jgi:hypothetical protein
MSNYIRVLPRDAFNEANLLKCIGRLTLLIHDNEIDWLKYEQYNDNEEGFNICQEESSGEIYITNLIFYLKKDNTEIIFTSCYNSKDNYPLIAYTTDNNYYRVFDENGNFLLTEEMF